MASSKVAVAVRVRGYVTAQFFAHKLVKCHAAQYVGGVKGSAHLTTFLSGSTIPWEMLDVDVDVWRRSAAGTRRLHVVSCVRAHLTIVIMGLLLQFE